MFQYALGRVLAEKHQVPLVLDGSWFDAEGWAQVSHFLNLPLKARVTRRLPHGARALRKLVGRHYWEYLKVPVLRENPHDHSFDPAFLEAPADCVLMGYFQTALYFGTIQARLRDEINGLLGRAAGPAGPIAEPLSEPGSVAVHVRRTDYMRLPIFQVCGPDYYQRSMDRMRRRLSRPRFFVFSDDPEWCQSEFAGQTDTVVLAPRHGGNPLPDLHLMSLASNHIICNSTYSWWGAWLGMKPEQRVIMPDRWYASEIICPIKEKRMPNWEVLGSGGECL